MRREGLFDIWFNTFLLSSILIGNGVFGLKFSSHQGSNLAGSPLIKTRAICRSGPPIEEICLNKTQESMKESLTPSGFDVNVGIEINVNDDKEDYDDYNYNDYETGNVCNKEFERVHGDVKGTGFYQRSGVKTAQRCGYLCTNQCWTCCSYEYSPKDKKCNMNMECHPNDPRDHKDYIFCKRKEEPCRDGYDNGVGHVDPFSNKTRRIEMVDSSDLCGQHCDAAEFDCCSYDYNLFLKVCDITSECEGTTEADYDGYVFCQLTAKRCRQGYKPARGCFQDLPGIGFRTELNIGTSDACGKLCDKSSFPTCCSYEWSLEKKQCNLNHKCDKPTRPKVGDFVFCAKDKED